MASVGRVFETFVGEGGSAVGRSFETAVTFVGKGNSAVGERSFETAATFVGKGSSAVGRSFEATGAELYCCWAGCGGLYELGCRGSLALVREEGEASGACADGVAYWGIDATSG